MVSGSPPWLACVLKVFFLLEKWPLGFVVVLLDYRACSRLFFLKNGLWISGSFSGSPEFTLGHVGIRFLSIGTEIIECARRAEKATSSLRLWLRAARMAVRPLAGTGLELVDFNGNLFDSILHFERLVHI